MELHSRLGYRYKWYGCSDHGRHSPDSTPRWFFESLYWPVITEQYQCAELPQFGGGRGRHYLVSRAVS